MITAEQRYHDLIEALETIEDIEQEAVQAGKIVDRDATATLWQRRADAINAIKIAEGR